MGTKVINLFAGPGSGKSTTAALLFGEMKLQGYNIELVTEYVKNMAWKGIKIQELDQLIILGQQIEREKSLYGKVDYIVTDSPVLLCGIYQRHYSNNEYKYISDVAENFINHTKKKEVEHINFFVKRNIKYNPNGRFENEEQALAVDDSVRKYLNEKGIQYTDMNCNPRDRVAFILEKIL